MCPLLVVQQSNGSVCLTKKIRYSICPFVAFMNIFVKFSATCWKRSLNPSAVMKVVFKPIKFRVSSCVFNVIIKKAYHITNSSFTSSSKRKTVCPWFMTTTLPGQGQIYYVIFERVFSIFFSLYLQNSNNAMLDEDLIQYYQFLADKGDVQAQVSFFNPKMKYFHKQNRCILKQK